MCKSEVLASRSLKMARTRLAPEEAGMFSSGVMDLALLQSLTARETQEKYRSDQAFGGSQVSTVYNTQESRVTTLDSLAERISCLEFMSAEETRATHSLHVSAEADFAAIVAKGLRAEDALSAVPKRRLSCSNFSSEEVQIDGLEARHVNAFPGSLRSIATCRSSCGEDRLNLSAGEQDEIDAIDFMSTKVYVNGVVGDEDSDAECRPVNPWEALQTIQTSRAMVHVFELKGLQKEALHVIQKSKEMVHVSELKGFTKRWAAMGTRRRKAPTAPSPTDVL